MLIWPKGWRNVKEHIRENNALTRGCWGQCRSSDRQERLFGTTGSWHWEQTINSERVFNLVITLLNLVYVEATEWELQRLTHNVLPTTHFHFNTSPGAKKTTCFLEVYVINIYLFNSKTSVQDNQYFQVTHIEVLSPQHMIWRDPTDLSLSFFIFDTTNPI